MDAGSIRSARLVFVAGSVLAGLAVVLGAFGAHGLQAVVTPQRLATFETGVRYQIFHALALMVMALAIERWPERRLARAAWWLLGGTVVFSGSLYLLVVTGVGWLGAVTPFGGAAMIAGWSMTVWESLRRS
jgi:uncharacterized membrane protein YgdD (TMEM256/DUF423 family)